MTTGKTHIAALQPTVRHLLDVGGVEVTRVVQHLHILEAVVGEVGLIRLTSGIALHTYTAIMYNTHKSGDDSIVGTFRM